MKMPTVGAAVWLVIGSFGVQAQTPAGASSPGPAGTKLPTETASVSGQVVAADTGKPLQRATVTLLAQPSKMTRIATTDANGRYEFSNLPGGRYGVSPSKEGYVMVSPDPFAGGRGLELSEGEKVERWDFSLPRGSVIAGRITDEFGEPVAGVMVQAARYQFRPGGQRQLIMGSSGNFFMPASTNDLGEFRIFGLRPGAYYISARPETSQAVGLGQNRPGAVSEVDSTDGQTTTYYPGTPNVADAQIVRVELMRVATASFALAPARMARITGVVRDSQGQPASARISLRQVNSVVGWFNGGSITQTPDGTFAIANVSPGEYLLDVRPGPGFAAAGRTLSSAGYASLPLTVSGDDITGLEVTTRPGVSVSGRVIFEGKAHVAQPNLRISAAPEDEARNVVGFTGPDGAEVSPDGEFHIERVFGRVLFRTGFLPQTVMLKSVRLNGVDITNTPLDTSGSENITGLEVVLVDKQSRIVGSARNARGELQYNFRLVIYPANLKPGDVGVRFQHNASPNNKGEAHIGRMPPGDYVGLAVMGVQPGEEWDPELRKRIEELGRRFTLKEDETLEVEFPYIE